jgi:pimeloyl-ACP methyl ester carboxylesterase
MRPTIRSPRPTVFLPGLLCDQSLWQNQVEALADVCAPMIANLTLDDTVEAMARRTLAAAPARFSLAGLSMGGYVAGNHAAGARARDASGPGQHGGVCGRGRNPTLRIWASDIPRLD